jgi:hypothetical protein
MYEWAYIFGLLSATYNILVRIQGSLTLSKIFTSKKMVDSTREIAQETWLLSYISALVILHSWTAAEEDGIAVGRFQVSILPGHRSIAE